jgi:hypothetical protein
VFGLAGDVVEKGASRRKTRRACGHQPAQVGSDFKGITLGVDLLGNAYIMDDVVHFFALCGNRLTY